MHRVALITDSSACLPPEVTASLGVRVLPIAIHLPSGDIDDGAARAPELVYGAAAAAHGLVVMAAAEVAAAGGSEAEVVRAAEDASRRAELVGVLDTLDFIRRSGRVP